MKRLGRILYAFLVCCLGRSILGPGEDISFSYGIISVGVFGAVYWLTGSSFQQYLQKGKKDKIFTMGLALLFFLAMCIGRMLDAYGYLNFGDIGALLAVPILTPLGGMLIHKGYEALECLTSNRTVMNEDRKMSWKSCMIVWLFLMLAWGVVLAGIYPGFFVYDAADELNEVVTRQFTTHHPLFHVLYLGGIVQAGYKLLGSYNLGIFAFTLMQMAIFAVGFVYVVYKVYAFGWNKKFCIGWIMFLAFFPVIPMIVLCSTKDSLFSLIMLLWTLDVYVWERRPEKGLPKLWMLWTVLLVLLRNNALFALIAAWVLIWFCIKEARKPLLGRMAISIIVAVCISAGLSMVFHAEQGGTQEILTVPIQQLARTYQAVPETFSAEEKETLIRYLPEEYLEKYRPKLSDSVKIGFQNEAFETDKAGFLKLWVEIGIRNPISYINAWLMTSYGYWYPDTIIDVYRGNQVYTFTYEDNSYFGYETEQPGVRESKIPLIDTFYGKLSLEIWKEKLPVISQLFSPGFMLWAFLFLVTFLWRRGGKKATLPYSMIPFIIATLLLGPTFLPRYVFFLWLCVPFLVGDILYSKCYTNGDIER